VPWYQRDAQTRLFYTDDPAAEPDLSRPSVLLVHGWGCDSHDWSHQIPQFVKRHRVIAVDSRGHGRSTGETGFAPRVFADDLYRLLTAVDAAPVVAIGHSLGGVVVNILAVEHPDLVSGVVVVDPGYGNSDSEQAQFEAMKSVLDSPDAADILAGSFAAMSGPTAPAHLKTWHHRRALGIDGAVLVETLRGIVAEPLRNRDYAENYFAGRSCPVLAVYAQTRADNAEWERSLLNEQTDGVHLVDAGHWLHQEQPELVNRLLSDWLATLPPAQR
jgi:pimeloyl-ACP methyl ester carboxylesterase